MKNYLQIKKIQSDNTQIMIANVRRYEYESVSQEIAQLIALKNSDPFVIVKKMKEIVPEFISNNSKFDILN